MGLREEFEEIRQKADVTEDKAQAQVESMWATKRWLVVGGAVFLLLMVGFALGRCSV